MAHNRTDSMLVAADSIAVLAQSGDTQHSDDYSQIERKVAGLYSMSSGFGDILANYKENKSMISIDTLIDVERQRSQYFTSVATLLQAQLDSFYELMLQMTDHVEHGDAWPAERASALTEEMQLASSCVQSIISVIESPALMMNQTVNKAQIEIISKTESSLARRKSVISFSSPKRPLIKIIALSKQNEGVVHDIKDVEYEATTTSAANAVTDDNPSSDSKAAGYASLGMRVFTKQDCAAQTAISGDIAAVSADALTAAPDPFDLKRAVSRMSDSLDNQSLDIGTIGSFDRPAPDDTRFKSQSDPFALEISGSHFSSARKPGQADARRKRAGKHGIDANVKAKFHESDRANPANDSSTSSIKEFIAFFESGGGAAEFSVDFIPPGSNKASRGAEIAKKLGEVNEKERRVQLKSKLIDDEVEERVRVELYRKIKEFKAYFLSKNDKARQGGAAEVEGPADGAEVPGGDGKSAPPLAEGELVIGKGNTRGYDAPKRAAAAQSKSFVLYPNGARAPISAALDVGDSLAEVAEESAAARVVKPSDDSPEPADEEGDAASVPNTVMGDDDLESLRTPVPFAEDLLRRGKTAPAVATRGSAAIDPPVDRDMVLVLAPYKKDKGTDTSDLKPPSRKGTARAVSRLLTAVPPQGLDQNSALTTDFSADLNDDDDDDDEMNSIVTELDIVSQIGGLVTRTYRRAPKADITAELLNSANPLLLLFNKFGAYITDYHKARLLGAAADEAAVASKRLLKNLFSMILPVVEKIDAALGRGLQDVSSCEKMSVALIALSEEGDKVPSATYRNSLEQMYRKIGDIEALAVWADVQLIEYRSIFKSINAPSMTSLPQLLQQLKAVNGSYEMLLASQSKVVEMNNRVAEIKNHCVKYKLAGSATWPAYRPSHASTAANGGKDQAGRSIAQGGSDAADVGSQHARELVRLETIIESLQDDLQAMTSERDDLNLEIFRVMQQGDQTPAALLFFSALADPVAVPTFQQIALQMSQLKSFVDGSAHVDYVTLKKRLSVCLTNLPPLERFIAKYMHLYKKWSSKRLALFMSKGLTGNAADHTAVCPMCETDSRVARAAPASAASKAGGAKAAKGLREEAIMKKKIKLLMDVEREKLLQDQLVRFPLMSMHSAQSSAFQELVNPREQQMLLAQSHSLPTLAKKKLVATIKIQNPASDNNSTTSFD